MEAARSAGEAPRTGSTARTRLRGLQGSPQGLDSGADLSFSTVGTTVTLRSVLETVTRGDHPDLANISGTPGRRCAPGAVAEVGGRGALWEGAL